MATFVEPDILSADIANKVHDFNSDSFYCALVTNANAPSVSATFLLSDITQIATGGGYTQLVDGGAGAKASTLSFSRSGQTTTVSTAEVKWTATGAVATFQWVIWVNDTPTSPLNPVIGWINHGSSITMASTDTYTIPAASTLFTIN